MTYCFAFKASPDGLGVISDTRLTSVNNLGELAAERAPFQKVYNPTSHSFIVVAGTLCHLRAILKGNSNSLRCEKPNKRYDLFLKLIKARYLDLFKSGFFSVNNVPDAEVIYGDCFRRRSKTTCRLLKIKFTIRNGQPAMGLGHGKQLEWSAIGWTPEGRRFLSDAATDALRELASRNAKIQQISNSDLEEFLGDNAPNKEASPVAFKLDTSRKRDSSFLPVLRNYCNQAANQYQDMKWFTPIFFLSLAPYSAIVSRMQQARNIGIPLHESVGDLWCLATVSHRYGFQIHKDSEMAVALSFFGPQPELMTSQP